MYSEDADGNPVGNSRGLCGVSSEDFFFVDDSPRMSTVASPGECRICFRKLKSSTATVHSGCKQLELQEDTSDTPTSTQSIIRTGIC